MPLKIIKVVIYGISDSLELVTEDPKYQDEYSGIETATFVDDSNFLEFYVNWEPDIVVVVGNIIDFPVISSCDYLKSKLYLLSKPELKYRGIKYFIEEFFKRYIQNSINNNNSINKISVYTVTCNIKDRIFVAYDSLKNQTHQNWEWSIYDDSTDGVTWDIVKTLAKSIVEF